MGAIFRVTSYITRGGAQRPDDPVAWTKDMTEDEYERWLVAETERAVLRDHGVDWGSDVKWTAEMDEDDVLDEPTDTEMKICGFGNDRERAARLAAELRRCGMLVSIERNDAA